MKPAQALVTSVRLPLDLRERLRVRAESQKVSMNALIEASIELYLWQLGRDEIDAAFAGMATDFEYQAESRLMAEEFGDGELAASPPVAGTPQEKHDENG